MGKFLSPYRIVIRSSSHHLLFKDLVVKSAIKLDWSEEEISPACLTSPGQVQKEPGEERTWKYPVCKVPGRPSKNQEERTTSCQVQGRKEEMKASRLYKPLPPSTFIKIIYIFFLLLIFLNFFFVLPRYRKILQNLH